MALSVHYRGAALGRTRDVVLSLCRLMERTLLAIPTSCHVAESLELLSQDVYSLDVRRRNEEFAGTSKERLRHFTIDVRGAAFFALEGVEDSEGC
jgi:hypothetical protein